jgi:hypothetical protein
MDDIKLTRALLAAGYNHDDLRRLQQRSELVRVRRGTYATESSLISRSTSSIDAWSGEQCLSSERARF